MRTKPHKPIALHIADGTFRPGRHAGAVAGTPLATLPPPRESLDATGQAQWMAIGAISLANGVLESRFLDALEMLCRAYDRQAHYEAVIDEQGEFLTTMAGGLMAHPAVRLLAQARDEIRRYLIEFGLTPSSANGVSKPLQQKRGVPNRAKDLA